MTNLGGIKPSMNIINQFWNTVLILCPSTQRQEIWSTALFASFPRCPERCHCEMCQEKKQIAIRGTKVILSYRWKRPLCVQAVNSHFQSVCLRKAGALLGCYCCWRLSTLGVKVMYWLFQCQLKADNIKTQLKTIPWISQGAHVLQPSAVQSQCSQWCSLWDMSLKHLT